MSYKDILRKRAKKNQSVSALQTFSPEHIIVSPLITEKTFSVESEQDNDKEKVNKYYFKVHSKANKNDVKQSISFLYKVDVEKVNIVIVPMKGRANRKLVRRSYKKAAITLKKGQKIDLVG